MEAEIRYLYHSGFAVKTELHFFIFDYYRDEPRGGGLADGVIDPVEIRDLDTVVFASHSHPDHFSRKIFDLKSGVEKIRFVLSSQIRTREAKEYALRIQAGQTCDLGDLTVRALKSTDAGAAFLVKADGLCIYHAGDLNWWHWEGEPTAENERMARQYREQIDTLRDDAVDVAFVPVDPRLGDSSLLGLDYFMKTVGAGLAVPMHSFGDTSFYEGLKSDPRTSPYLTKIWFYKNRGDATVFKKPNPSDGE